jgi:hypothetical protein
MSVRVPRALLMSGAMTLSLLGLPAALRAQTPVTTAPTPGAPAEEIETLRQRAAAFWAARIAGNSTAQWDLLEPRGKGRLTPSEYAPTEGPAKYLAYQVEEALVSGSFATVKVRLLVQPILPVTSPRKIPPAAVLLEDRWVRIGGVWYRSLEQEGDQAPQIGQRGGP